MLFIKDIRSSRLYTLSKATGPHYLLIIADTTCDLLIMHACDIFCDELILLHMLFQSAVITLLYFTMINIRLRSFHEIRTGTNF